jgi:hypothetical protein
MTTIERVLRRANKVARRESFEILMAAIEARPLGSNEKQRFRSRIIAGLTARHITPSESRKLLKAVEGGSHGTKRR